MMQFKIQILLVFIQLRLHNSIAQVIPIIESSPIIQTGNWSCSTNCSLYTAKTLYITINFTYAFTQIPLTGVVITQMNDTSPGNNLILTTHLESTITTLVSFQIYIGSSNCQNLTFGWIATSSQDVFITQTRMCSRSSNFSYSTWLPKNIGQLESFILMRGGYTNMGGIATSILDTAHNQITVTLNPTWDTNSQNTYVKFFLIVVNSQSTTSNNTQLRVLSGQFHWLNQKIIQIPTFIVSTGQQQNMLIGLQSYYNAQSNWSLAISQLSSNKSSITYSLNFNPLSIVTFQYLQLEVFVCVNSVFLSDNCTCNGGYFASLNVCQQCDYSCLSCFTLSNNCTACPPLSLRNLNVTSCFCQMGYYDNNQVNCSTCNTTCLSCFGGSSSQCNMCNVTQNLVLVNGSCICRSGYFQNTTNQCQSCDMTCYQCTGKMANQCSACRESYFLNLYNSCQECSYQCFTCQSALECSTCDSINHRTNLAGTCLCDIPFYNDGLNQLCKISKNSLCRNGYFNYSSKICHQCNYSCLTCDIDGCVTCPQPRMNRISVPNSQRNCPCLQGAIQNNLDQQCQSVCGDGIKLQNEGCDDGNTINLDGCSSQCIIETGFSCSVQFNLSSCSLSTILNCIQSDLNNMLNNIIICLMCSPQYYLSQDNLTCILCNSNCDGCVGSDISQCKKCSKISIAVTSTMDQLQREYSLSEQNPTIVVQKCQRCENFPGLFYVFNVGCSSFCGDNIIRTDRGEQCDDGNFLSGDGCSSECQVEVDFICYPQNIKQLNDLGNNYFFGPSRCNLRQGPIATLSYTKKNDVLLLIFSNNIKTDNFCSFFSLTIQSLKQEQFSFLSQNLTKNSCSIQLFLNVSLQANQMIILRFNQTIKDQDDGVLVTNQTQLKSNQYTYYTPEQQAQAQSTVQAQSFLNWLLLFLGLIIILIGGAELYWSILDIMTWVDTLYFINVNYPLNIQLFYQYASWTNIFQIPNPIVLNQPTDQYYQTSPQNFQDKGFTGCFLASVTEDIQFCIAAITIYLLSALICQVFEKIYTKHINPKSLTSQLFQLDNNLSGTKIEAQEIAQQDYNTLSLPRPLVPIYNQLNQIRNSFTTIFIKLTLLVFIDFQVASILQIQAGQFNKHPFIAMNIILAVLFQICGLYLPFYFYSVINQSQILINNESYEKKFSAIYEDVNIKEIQGKMYCIFSVVKKTIFVYFLTYLYDYPILQSVGCTLACCMNIILICFKSPFEYKMNLFKYLLPETAIFLSLATSILFALNDQVIKFLYIKNQMFDESTKFQLGWMILFFIMSSVLIQCLFLLSQLRLVIKQRCSILFNCQFQIKQRCSILLNCQFHKKD